MELMRALTFHFQDVESDEIFKRLGTFSFFWELNNFLRPRNVFEEKKRIELLTGIEVCKFFNLALKDSASMSTCERQSVTACM